MMTRKHVSTARSGRLTRAWYELPDAARLRVLILAGLLTMGVLLSLLVAWFSPGIWWHIWLNLGSELIGTALTFLLVDLLLQRHGSAAQAEAATPAEPNTYLSRPQLIARLGSRASRFALSAADALRSQGWLTDDSLHGAALQGTNLQGANLAYAQLNAVNLSDANLAHADLDHALLREARLDGANLEQAYLQHADLEQASLVAARLNAADLRQANLTACECILTDMQQSSLHAATLRRALLSRANLQHADLQHADLTGAQGREVDLRGANLRHARLHTARFDHPICNEETILPDGQHWSRSHQIQPFTETAEPPAAPAPKADITRNGTRHAEDIHLLRLLLNEPEDTEER
ncbi:MAG: pentapeptide repeat-containing protein [Chloroflexaceae bacterium]|nr:pentapeptide repeat-containing protein [Chloroflexaceae bacterium]